MSEAPPLRWSDSLSHPLHRLGGVVTCDHPPNQGAVWGPWMMWSVVDEDDSSGDMSWQFYLWSRLEVERLHYRRGCVELRMNKSDTPYSFKAQQIAKAVRSGAARFREPQNIDLHYLAIRIARNEVLHLPLQPHLYPLSPVNLFHMSLQISLVYMDSKLKLDLGMTPTDRLKTVPGSMLADTPVTPAPLPTPTPAGPTLDVQIVPGRVQFAESPPIIRIRDPDPHVGTYKWVMTRLRQKSRAFQEKVDRRFSRIQEEREERETTGVETGIEQS